ncbi:hypothetical protein FPV67DRAFT_1449804 [Lyophyllum atratum]|nr:hypothetical protein FPV67DRAFT_1449804 [Lyophyllum atratum]
MAKQAIEKRTPAIEVLALTVITFKRQETKSDAEVGKEEEVSVESVVDELDRLKIERNCDFCGRPKVAKGWALFPAKALRDRLKEGEETVEWEDWTTQRRRVVCRACIEALIDEGKETFRGLRIIDAWWPELEKPVGWKHSDGWEADES